MPGQVSELARKYWELDPALGAKVVGDDVLFQRGWCWPTEGDALALLETSKFMVDGRSFPSRSSGRRCATRSRLPRRSCVPRTRRRAASPIRRSSRRRKRRTCVVRRYGRCSAGASAPDRMTELESERNMNVGFIGLGTMGAPMARNLLKKGHRLIVADVQPAAVAALTAAGATAAATPRDVAAASDIVITMLPDAPDVERVALGPDGIVAGIRPGSIYIDMSTIDPGTTRKVGAAIAAKGAAMIDWPVGKTADAAVAGTLTLMVGGPARRRSALPAGARCDGHRLLPLRRARRRADDEAHQQPARHGRVGSLDRGARHGHEIGPDARHHDERPAHDDGVEQCAGDCAAEAAARRRFRAGLHDEAGAQGLSSRAADGRIRWA